MSNVVLPPSPDQCPACSRYFIEQAPPVFVGGKVKTVHAVVFKHADGKACTVASDKVPWLYNRMPIYFKPPVPVADQHAKAFGGPSRSHRPGVHRAPVAEPPPPSVPVPSTPTQQDHLEAILRATVDRHMQAIMTELEGLGAPSLGVVVGVLHNGETSVSWAIDDKVRGDDGGPVSPQSVAHEIALDIERVTGEPE
jgi:hypothetical protein